MVRNMDYQGVFQGLLAGIAGKRVAMFIYPAIHSFIKSNQFLANFIHFLTALQFRKIGYDNFFIYE